MTDTTSQTDSAIADLRRGLDERLTALDRPGAVALALAAVREGKVDIDQLYTRVLGPLLVETGAEWQRGDMQVWQEHFATAIVRTIVEALSPDVIARSARVPGNGKTALLATPSEESHDLGLRMLADRLALAGWHVEYLGPDTPALQIALAAEALHADLIALSIATHYNRALLREQIDEIKMRLPGVEVGVGGPAFARDRNWPTEELLTETQLGLSTTNRDQTDLGDVGDDARQDAASPETPPASNPNEA